MTEWGLNLVGGDTNEADDVMIDCILAGFADRTVERGGAGPGELVVVTGEFGTTSAGLKILLEDAALRSRVQEGGAGQRLQAFSEAEGGACAPGLPLGLHGLERRTGHLPPLPRRGERGRDEDRQAALQEVCSKGSPPRTATAWTNSCSTAGRSTR